MKNQIAKELKRFIPATLAFTTLALTINLLSWRYTLVSGGFPGYGLFISYLTNLSVGTVLFILNSIIFIITFLVAGKKTGLRALFGYIFFSFIIDYTRQLLQLNQVTIQNDITSFYLLAIQGLLAGGSVAVFIKSGYSAGGWGTVVFAIQKYIKITPQKFFLTMDILLSVLVAFQYGIIKGLLLFVNAFTFNWGFRLVNKLFIKNKLT
jgi:uncharacterized membrane-anchored protein YitT (DUF2179 family)